MEKRELEKILYFINNMPESVKEVLPYYPIHILKHITKLPESIAEGDAYKIHLEGDLKEDGYERALLLLLKGSKIKLHEHKKDVEIYKLLKGALIVFGRVVKENFCNIGESHHIDTAAEDTVVLTFKVASKYKEKNL